jgi:hypothetical protein
VTKKKAPRKALWMGKTNDALVKPVL